MFNQDNIQFKSFYNCHCQKNKEWKLIDMFHQLIIYKSIFKKLLFIIKRGHTVDVKIVQNVNKSPVSFVITKPLKPQQITLIQIGLRATLTPSLQEYSYSLDYHYNVTCYYTNIGITRTFSRFLHTQRDFHCQVQIGEICLQTFVFQKVLATSKKEVLSPPLQNFFR